MVKFQLIMPWLLFVCFQEVDDSNVNTEPTENGTRDDPLSMNHKDGNTLDVLMNLMFGYIHDICHGIKRTVNQKQNGFDSENTSEHRKGDLLCKPGSVKFADNESQRTVGCACGGSEHDIDALKNFFTDLKDVFSRIILKTHASSHTQFLMFYLLALRPGLATIFLEFLRVRKFENPNCFRDERHNAMAYIGSLLARGKFIPFCHVHSCLEIICSWCNSYLENQVSNNSTNCLP